MEVVVNKTYVESWPDSKYGKKLKKALKNVRLVAGSSHPELAQSVANQLGIPLTDMGVSYFSNMETRVKPTAAPESTFRGKRVFIVQTGSYSKGNTGGLNLLFQQLRGADDTEAKRIIAQINGLIEALDGRTVNDHVMEVALMMDACARGGAKNITLLIPCYPYARQDKKDTSRAPISAAVVAEIFQIQKMKRIVSFDLHNPCIQGLFMKCSDNLFPTKVLREWLMNNVFHATTVGDKSYTDRFVLIAPDAGATPKVEKVAGYLGLDFLTMNKVRDYNKKNTVKNIQLQCDPKMLEGHTPEDFLKGKTAIILDDIVDTFGTVDAAIAKLMSYGVEGCIVAATHGVLSGPALQRINNCKGLKFVLVSDTLPQAENMAKCDKIRVYSISGMLTEVVRRTITNRSFSSLI